MSQHSHPRSELLFEFGTGKLFSAHNKMGGNASDMTPLRSMLDASGFRVTRGWYGQIDTAEWQRTDYIGFGRFILNVLRTVDQPEPEIQNQHIQRSHLLGLCPNVLGFAYMPDSHFKSLTDFQEQATSIERVPDAGWTTWPPARYRRRTRREPQAAPMNSYAMRSKPTESEAIELSNEYEAWDATDHIIWGSWVQRANPDMELTADVYELLRARGFAPDPQEVTNIFGSWQHFQAAVATKRLDEYMQLERKINRYRIELDTGTLPASLQGLNDQELLVAAGRYHTAIACLGRHRTRRAETLAHSDSFESELRYARYNMSLTKGKIETAALITRAYDDLWPVEIEQTDLRVTPDELADFRRQRQLL